MEKDYRFKKNDQVEVSLTRYLFLRKDLQGRKAIIIQRATFSVSPHPGYNIATYDEYGLFDSVTSIRDCNIAKPGTNIKRALCIQKKI